MKLGRIKYLILALATANAVLFSHQVLQEPGYSMLFTESDSSFQEKLTTPAPTSAKDFSLLWEKEVKPEEWGGADVSLSVKITDGRTAWLYGDTPSINNGFVNSSAIVQDGGNLHVSHGGKQLLPKGKAKDSSGYHTVYWIEAARSAPDNGIIATVAETAIGGKSVWDFKRVNPNSWEVLLKVTPTGDIDFVRWLKETAAPQLDHTLITFDKTNRHHFAYGKQEHQQFSLSSGKTLLTYSQNWDDVAIGEFKRKADGEIDWNAYRPIFTETPLKEAF